MESRSGLPSFWSTHIAKVLVGDQPCLLQPWIQGRFELPKSTNSDMASWKANHTAMLQEEVAKYKDAGWQCDVERFFRVTGTVAILSGKADLVVRKADERPRIIDVKSGKPRDSDMAQVLIEMISIPLAWKAPEMQFEGLVVYGASGPSKLLKPIQAETIKPKLFALLRQLGTMERPTPSPSRDACCFCDVPDAECGQRFQDSDSVSTDLF